jgi:hypothetical protein
MSSLSTSRKPRSSALHLRASRPAKEFEFDIIIYAGFDAITGGFDKVDFRGVGGAKLKDVWKSGPETYLGLMVHGFPNMMMIMGPHRARQHSARHRIQRRLGHRADALRTRQRIDAAGGNARRHVQDWTDHVKALGVGLFQRGGFLDDGINRNVEGKQTRIIARYSGSAPAYRAATGGGAGLQRASARLTIRSKFEQPLPLI